MKSAKINIPFLVPYIGEEEIEKIATYLNSGGFLTEHKLTEEAEKSIAKFLKVKYVSLVTSGTAALYLSLLASNLPKQAMVALPDLTDIATYNAIIAANLRPVLVDVDSAGCLDIEKIPKDVQCVVYVSLNGRSGDMRRLVQFCQKRNITLIEDACQSLGSSFHGKHLGTFGKFGCYSLAYNKIITAGQGGIVATHDKKDYQKIEQLKDQGKIETGGFVVGGFGMNFKYTDIQSAFLTNQIKNLNQRIEKKRKIYEWYFGVKPPNGYTPWVIEHRSDNSSSEFERLTKLGINCRKMYPPLHTQKIIRSESKFPKSDYISKTTLWLPSSLSLTRKEVNYINEHI